MKEPAFDRNGYPTEETLDTIKNWPMEDAANLPAFVAACWHWPERARETSPGLWAFSTGGWSGNESLLGAMESGLAWMILGWDSIYVAGGLMVVATTPEAKAKMDLLHDSITNWAWKGGYLMGRID